MGESTHHVRTLTAADSDDFVTLFLDSFLENRRELMRDELRSIFVPGRACGVFDDSELIGAASMLLPELTLPGETVSPLAAVTGVAVKPDHRRQGILTALMRAQFEQLRENRAAPIAALYASSGGIYGRFGYSVACAESRLSLPRAARFKPGVEIDPKRVREPGADSALGSMRKIHERARTHRPGWLSRDDEAWHQRVANEHGRPSEIGALRYAVHPDGYVLYRAKSGWGDRGPAYELHIQELVALTPGAYAALWRYLLDLDFVHEVHWHKASVDEPVVAMLADPRQARRRVTDGLWMRLVDLPAALAARRYSATVDAVLEVTDSVCPWNAGRWRMRAVADEHAEVTATDRAPDVRLDIADLATVYLGAGTLFSRLNAISYRSPDERTLRRLSRALAGDQPPHCPENF